jgi:hypothetical protein
MPDLIGRRCAPANLTWPGSATSPTTQAREGWLYLGSVLDLGSRRWLGHSVAGRMRTELVSDALNMVVSTRGGHVKGTIFHGDRGSQYMSGDYRKLVIGHKMHRYRFATRAEARRAIVAWINRYNSRRRHSTLGDIAPIAWEQNYIQPRPPRQRHQRDRPTGEVHLEVEKSTTVAPPTTTQAQAQAQAQERLRPPISFTSTVLRFGRPRGFRQNLKTRTSTTRLSMAKTLVIVLAETRAHEITFRSFKEHVLDALDADLALCVADNSREDPTNPFYVAARYVWRLSEPDDWGDLFDGFQRQIGADGDWRRLLEVGSMWLGGVDGDPAQPGSAGILLAFRWFLKTTLSGSDALNQYDRFIVTRSDFVHLTPHVPLTLLDSGFIWIPDGEDYGGFTDRHIVASRQDILDVLAVADDLVADPDALYERLRHRDDWNLERVIRADLDHLGLSERVRRFPYTMYAVRPEGGHTSWSTGKFAPDLGYFVKYAGELRSARIARRILAENGWSAARVAVVSFAIKADRKLQLWLRRLRRKFKRSLRLASNLRRVLRPR